MAMGCWFSTLLLRLFLLTGDGGGDPVGERILDVLHRGRGAIDAAPCEGLLEIKLSDQGMPGQLVDVNLALDVNLPETRHHETREAVAAVVTGHMQIDLIGARLTAAQVGHLAG